MSKDFSPEEKLLKLIRSKAPAPAQTDAKRDNIPAPLRPMPVSANVPAPKRYAKPAYHQPVRTTSGQAKVLKLENLNLVLVILLVGMLGYLIPQFFKKPKSTIQELEEKIKAQEKSQAQTEQESKRPPFNYFSEQVGTKNVFQPIVKEETPTQAVIDQGPKLEDIKGQLNLLGVIWGDKPQAIIEDKKANKTYFLNKGETFGDIEVKDILENKVILSYKEQQFDLVL